MTTDVSEESPQWSALMVNDHLVKVADAMTAEMIMTPSAGWVTIDLESDAHVAIELMERGFDQLPVLYDGKVVGIVLRTDIEQMGCEDKRVSEIARGVASIQMARTTDNFSTVCDRLVATPFCLVFSPRSGEIVGLIHFADLNRQAVRTYCYLWLSALEMGLAELLMSHIPNYNEWIRHLPEMRQVTVLGRYAYERRQNIELSPIEGLDLSDLVRLCSSQSSVLKSLGLSKTQFAKRTGPIIKMRNAAMHPVRSLVRRQEAVPKLHERLQTLRQLVAKTHDSLALSK